MLEKKTILFLCILICVVSNYTTWQLTRKKSDPAMEEAKRKIEAMNIITDKADEISAEVDRLHEAKDYQAAGILMLRREIFCSFYPEVYKGNVNSSTAAAACFHLAKTQQHRDITSEAILSKLFPRLRSLEDRNVDACEPSH